MAAAHSMGPFCFLLLKERTGFAALQGPFLGHGPLAGCEAVRMQDERAFPAPVLPPAPQEVAARTASCAQGKPSAVVLIGHLTVVTPK